MGHVVRDVELYFLSHGRNGVALTSLGAELRRNEVRTISLFWALLTFWVDFRVVLRRSLLYLHANCTVECVMSQSSPSYITVAQSPLGALQLRTDVRTQFITFAKFWLFLVFSHCQLDLVSFGSLLYEFSQRYPG